MFTPQHHEQRGEPAMQMIAAADRNWGIGLKNRLLVRIPSDMKFFRNETTGKTVIMGRKTLETFPGGKPLPDRRNIVLTRDVDYRADGAEIVHSVEEALELVKDVPSDEVYVIGGGEIYKLFLPYCDTAHITKIDEEYEADAHFPNLDENPEWEITADSEEQTYFDIIFYFLKYTRKTHLSELH